MRLSMIRTISVVMLLMAATNLYARTETYTFVTAQSTVTQTYNYSPAPPDRLYSITGSFQMTIDDDGARFDWVDAVLTQNADLGVPTLGEVFRMTDLTGTIINSTTIQFVLNETGPQADSQTQITVTVGAGSATLTGQMTQSRAGGATYNLNAFASLRPDAWSYFYLDDFLTDKAKRDSYSHSTFWPANAYPPPEPHLHYYGSGQARSLIFIDYQGQPAHLGYQFPIGAHADRRVQGLLELDVGFPDNDTISQAPPGYLMYSLSPDGHNWSTPEPLSAGHHQIPVQSLRGAFYVMLLGARTAIDNLQVNLTSPPATIHVPGDFVTIQDAINASADADVIEVAPGIYRGPGNTDIDFLGKAITVRSSDGPEATVIDCSGSGSGGTGGLAGARLSATQQGHQRRGFYFHSNETRNSVLRGFTIRAGRIPGDAIPPDSMRWNLDPAHPIGGGIYTEFASPTIVDCVVRNCGTEYGGGIGCAGGQPVIVGCLIENCKAGGYGALESGGYGGGIALIRQSNAIISDCEIRQNSSYYNSQGAAVYCRRSSVKISDSDISNNGPQNESTLTAGTIYCSDSQTSVTLTNCIVSHNRAHLGAALYAAEGQLIPEQPRCNVRITNCTVAQNRILPGPWLRPTIDAAIQSFGCDTVVKNSIVYYNQGAQITITDPASNSPVIYCDVQGGYVGTGNIDVDPLFAPVGSRDYHLQSLYGRYNPATHAWVRDTAHSLCIDAGDPTDYVGSEPLPNGKRINMGAYGGTAEASKGTGTLVYHVDIVNGHNSNNGLSRDSAFATIQKGIDSAHDKDIVLVWPGVYREQVNFKGKAITVQSAADAATVVAERGYAFSFFMGEGADSILRNFVISDGEYGVYCMVSSPTLSNLTVVGNAFGIAAYGGADPDISNCVFYDNSTGDLFQCQARHSRLRNGPSHQGQGNIYKDPLFADPNNGDYHLKSKHGRYWPEHDLWVLDKQTSPCIDAGDPAARAGRERKPNGGRVNMGAYGGTPHASMSRWRLRGDANRDGVVSFKDLSILAAEWLDREDWLSDTEPDVTVPGAWQGQHN